MVLEEDKVRALKIIEKAIKACAICRMGKLGKAVAGEGGAHARVVFVGEAPGKLEAVTGRPFVGRSGNVLRTLIAELGLREEEVFITSVVKYLPVYGTPTLADIEHGRKHLVDQLEVLRPRLVVLLGRVAAQGVLECSVNINKEHSTFYKMKGNMYSFLTYHPASVLYAPKNLPKLKKDFAKIKDFINKKSR